MKDGYNMKHDVAIVIPIYKSRLLDYEKASLKQCYRVLNGYPIYFVMPASLDFSVYREFVDNENCHLLRFPDAFFKDVQGYNRLMLSDAFYGNFLSFEYILIYQLDAFVFKDELSYWCKKDYDYIGAPWVNPPKWKKTIKSYFHFKRNKKQEDGHLPTWLQFHNKVGNGGFSLRRTRILYELCQTEKALIDFYNANNESHFFNEDVFWSLEVNRKKKRLRIPGYRKALLFSIEQNPDLAMRLNKGVLPFGAHGLYAYPDFWGPLLAPKGYNLF